MVRQDRTVKEFFDAQGDTWEGVNYVGDSLNAVTFLDRKRKVESLLEISKGQVVLEAGCGPGIFIPELLKKGFNAYGSDIAPRMVEQLRKKFPKKKGHFCVADLRKLPYPKGKFDWVIAVGVLPYLHDDDVALAEIARVLKRGGRAVFTFNKRSGPNVILRGLLYRFTRHARKKSMLFNDIRLNAHSRKGLFSLLEDQGFKVEEYVESNYKLLPFSAFMPGFFVWLTGKVKGRRHCLANESIVRVMKR